MKYPTNVGELLPPPNENPPRSLPQRVCATLNLRTEDNHKKETIVTELVSTLGISPITAAILHNRGVYDSEQARLFLNPSLREGLPPPFEIKNINAAATLILDFVASKKKITIFTDFDVDGLTAGSQLLHYLLALGGNVATYTPNRFTEGYGLNTSIVNKLATTGTQLLITVDCGISNHKEIALAKKLGLSTIVLDHHHPENLPPADVVVDPAQPDCPFHEYSLAAAGLVWMLLVVLRAKCQDNATDQGRAAPDPRDYLDLAALGTICDMVPLTKINRLLAIRGLELINRNPRPGLAALKAVSGLRNSRPLSAGSVGFSLGPRINAAGRMHDACEVVELLLTKNESRARTLAESLDFLNKKRKSIEESMREDCLTTILGNEKLLENKVLVIYSASFHEGVLGIVAQRIAESFHRPAVIIAPASSPNNLTSSNNLSELKEGRLLKGSVRGIKGFHVANALQALDSFLLSHGGHSGAGGFSIREHDLVPFQEAFYVYANKHISEDDLRKKISADLQISFSQISFSLVEELDRLAPFGIGNPAPLFYSEKVVVSAVFPLAGNSIRVKLQDKNLTLNAVAWGQKGNPLLHKHRCVNVVYSVEVNSYNGLESLQLDLKEVWPADE